MNILHSNLHFSKEELYSTVPMSEVCSPGRLTFEYQFPTSLKHSNATQNIYFSNYVEWQGAIRERWFYECVTSDMLNQEGVFVTKEVQQHYIKEGFPFQTIVCYLNSFNVQRCAFWLLFRFFSQGELLSYGCQQVVFTNHDKKIVRLPKDIIAKVKRYQWVP